ncbi:hypothetical protein GCM10009735_85240 [Actinomadura chokoriensis]
MHARGHRRHSVGRQQIEAQQDEDRDDERQQEGQWTADQQQYLKASLAESQDCAGLARRIRRALPTAARPRA